MSLLPEMLQFRNGARCKNEDSSLFFPKHNGITKTRNKLRTRNLMRQLLLIHVDGIWTIDKKGLYALSLFLCAYLCVCVSSFLMAILIHQNLEFIIISILNMIISWMNDHFAAKMLCFVSFVAICIFYWIVWCIAKRKLEAFVTLWCYTFYQLNLNSQINVYLWCDYFILVGCSFEFHFVATTHITFALKIGTKIIVIVGLLLLPLFLLLALLLLSSVQLLWRLLCIDETVPFFIPSRRRRHFVCTQNCYYYHFLNVHRLLQFSILCCCFLCLDRTLSYLFRSQLVFKCSQLTRYWHTLIHTQVRRLTTVSGARLCALFSPFSLSLSHSVCLCVRKLCFTQKYHFELNDRMPLEMCLNNLFPKMIFLRPLFSVLFCFSSFFWAITSYHNHQWVIDNWERYSDFPNRRSLEI